MGVLASLSGSACGEDLPGSRLPNSSDWFNPLSLPGEGDLEADFLGDGECFSRSWEGEREEYPLSLEGERERDFDFDADRDLFFLSLECELDLDREREYDDLRLFFRSGVGERE